MSAKRLDIRLAVNPGALDGAEWHALRLGDVYDPDSGELVVTVTDELCRDIVTAFDAFGGRMQTVLGRDHGLFRKAGDKRSRGAVAKVRHAEGEGLFITPSLNALGRDEVAAEGGALWLSPTIKGPAFDPSSGERVSGAWMPEVTLTPMPRQDRLQAVSLSRDGDAPVQQVALARFEGADGSANAHREQLAQAARVALAEAGITPGHMVVEDWSDQMVVVNAWRWDDGDISYDKWFRFDVADGDDGRPVLSNRTEVQPLRTYEPVASATPSTSLSRAPGAPTKPAPATPGEEDRMSVKDGKVELARTEHEALLDDRNKLAELSRQHEEQGVELARLQKAEADREAALKLSRAEAFADGLLIEAGEREQWVQAHVANPEQAELLSRSLRRKADEAAEAFGEKLLSRGAIPADRKAAWVDAYKANPEGTEALAATIPDGATAPVGKAPVASLSRGEPELTDAEKAAAKATENRSKAEALQKKTPGLTYAAALSRVESGEEVE